MFLYCPHCAAPNPQFLKGKKILCEKCGFQFYHNTAASVAVLIEQEGRYIFLKRGKDPGRGLLDLPGGFIDPGETAEEACKREIMEEIGIPIGNLRFLFSHPNTYPYKGITYKTCDLLFQGKAGGGEFVRQEEEVEEILLLRKEEISLNDMAFPSIRNMLKQTFRMLDNDPVL
jgi:NAD+ diphosphatase